MGQIAQVRRILFNDEEIGMGFDSASGLAVGRALEGFTVNENPNAGGAEVTSSISIVTSHENLQQSLGMGFDAEGRYGFISASVKTRFSEQTSFNSASTFLVASVLAKNALRRGQGFRVTADAAALLQANRIEEFTRAFGDSFVRGLQTGGEFLAVIRITSVSSKTQNSLAIAFQAEANGLLASGSFKGAFEQANASENTRSEFTATMYQRAGQGASIAPTVTIEEVLARFRSFPEIAAASASAYETEVATYDTIPLPLPTPTEQDTFVQALADARQHKLRYIELRNDYEFALRNPQFFEALPPAAELSKAVSDYSRLLNAAAEHAIKVARGQVDATSRFFDPLKANPPQGEPQALVLTRTGEKVEIFTHANFAPEDGGVPGRSQKLAIGRYDDSKSEILLGNDQISSLLVPPGLAVRAYDHAWFQGAFIDFTADVPAVPMDWNDRISSLIVYDADDPPPVIDFAVGLDFAWSPPIKIFAVGDYPDLAATEMGSNRLSTLLIPRGIRVQLFDQANFAGNSADFFADTLELPAEWNNRAASVRVSKTS